jgi:hypothetical protein
MQNITAIIGIVAGGIILPLIIALLLWNKSEWLVKLILGDNSIFSTKEKSNETEIESIVMTAIGLTVIVLIIPRIITSLESVPRYTSFDFEIVLRYHFIPLTKLIIGNWLILRSRKQWKKSKLQD